MQKSKQSIAYIKKEPMGYYSINGIYHGEDLWSKIESLYIKHIEKKIVINVTWP